MRGMRNSIRYNESKKVCLKQTEVGDDINRKEDELGVLTVGLLDFLTDKNLLEQG